MKVIVCGGRDYADKTRVEKTLNRLLDPKGRGPEVMAVGDATGADTLAYEWAKANRVKCHKYYAAWSDISQPNAVIRTRRDGSKYDAMAGPRRNQLMLDETKPDLLIAFPGGDGTADMVRRAEAAGVSIMRIKGENNGD